jgi:hypothetical protein
MPQPLSVHLLYPKTNTFGLLDDVVVMERFSNASRDLTPQPPLHEWRGGAECDEIA